MERRYSDTKIDVVVKAFQDERFRKLLLSDPKRALEGFRLSPEDTKAVTGLTAESFELAARKMDADLYKLLRSGAGGPSVAENAGVWDAIED